MTPGTAAIVVLGTLLALWAVTFYLWVRNSRGPLA